MAAFSLHDVWIQFPGYGLSYLEAIATSTGLISVALATRPHVATWPTGLVSVTAFFFLFGHIGLYSDMILQVFFFGISVYGWVTWQKKTGKPSLPITALSAQSQLKWLVGIVLGTAILGGIMTQIHLWLPSFFSMPAAFPFPDAFTTAASIAATVLMARKKWECWWLWIAIDIACIGIYWLKDIRFVAAEYVIFLGMAIFGLITWKKQLSNASGTRPG